MLLLLYVVVVVVVVVGIFADSNTCKCISIEGVADKCKFLVYREVI